MANALESYLTGSNIDFIEAQYARFLSDPASVDVSWRALFDPMEQDGRPLITEGLSLSRPKSGVPGQEASHFHLQSKVDQTVFSFRLRGHLRAELDPLGMPRPPLQHVADMGLVSPGHFTDAELAQQVDSQTAFDEARVPLKRLMERMRNTYCRHIGVEYTHMYDSDRRRWLLQRMERCENTTPFTPVQQRRILEMLTLAETFETTIHTRFQAAKRFSVEGGEVLLPMLDALLEYGSTLGIRDVVFGMAHRGRLNVLCNILGKPADEIFSEFAGPEDPTRFLNRGDVKYHLGYASDWRANDGSNVHVNLTFNPSHLGVVYPVVEGRVRARQDRMGGGEKAKLAICPVVIHGDAAFAGQGLVAETLNCSALPAYETGGTVHVILNNQIGYTTEAGQARSSLYCTGQAQLLDIPVFHVNGDDPEACVHVMHLAVEYRQRFHTDVVIDVVCYRKYGHNEGDEPAFTQPKMYEVIRAMKPLRAKYADSLVERARIEPKEAKAIYDGASADFAEAHAAARRVNKVKDPEHPHAPWENYVGGADTNAPQVVTGVPLPRLKVLMDKLATTPPGFVLHSNVQRGVIDKRQKMIKGEEPLDWGAGEMLAYATLVTEGFRVRLTGQDTERGTFAHRHAVLHDMKTGRQAFPLGELSTTQARAEVANSPLSEMACMGYEFGYSLELPDGLTAWEAQFGDFANNGQVMIDQFIAAAEDKWKYMSGLTLLLPHGYEGAGPEHSSARLERFLQLAAEDNMQVCYPTSAAQIFHLLRRQVLRRIRKPLVVMTPKSLLRLAEACSPWDDFVKGTYRRVIADESVPAADVTKLLLCSGKVFFDLKRARDLAKDTGTAIVRVEQLYPLPVEELQAVLASLPKLTEVRWVQEEPKNSGAWRFLQEHLEALCAPRNLKPTYVGRPETASPATGFPNTHAYEQKLLVDESLARGTHVR